MGMGYKKLVKFIWDWGNKEKNWLEHKVSDRECEEVFFDQDKREYPDPVHSKKEIRKIVVGKTKKGRLLFVVYTVRGRLIRVISARDLSKGREADLYEKAA
ncbi:BrnT family toxin [Patescibacteria group bacterium]|nr:BrnT family toxin [Patescibacteria group bacterium]